MSSIGDPTPEDQEVSPALPHPDVLRGLPLGHAALRYAQEGLRVLPLQPGGKEPLGQLVPRGLLHASADIRVVSRWWSEAPRANIGLVTGPASFDVLDVDVRPSGSGGALVAELLLEGALPAPAHVVNTPSGGQHLYYRGSAQRSTGLHRGFVDLKAAGGYVVAPPSVIQLPGGSVTYQEIPEKRTGQAASALPWQTIVRRHHGHGRAAPACASLRTGPRGPHGMAGLVRFVRDLPEGNRNRGLFWAFCRALENRWPLEPLIEAAKAAGLSEAEIAQTLRSAQRTVG